MVWKYIQMAQACRERESFRQKIIAKFGCLDELMESGVLKKCLNPVPVNGEVIIVVQDL